MRSVALIALLTSACSGDDSAPLRCPFGDPTAPVQLEIVHLDADFNVVATMADTVLPLIVPPQGGWAVLIGARATNIDGCQMNLATSFRDACEPTVLKFDMRPSQPLIAQGDGWGLTPLADFSNLQLCPTPGPLRNLFNEPFLFTVTVDDIDGKRASTEVRLSAQCPADNPRCACECDKDYNVGEACPPAADTPSAPAC